MQNLSFAQIKSESHKASRLGVSLAYSTIETVPYISNNRTQSPFGRENTGIKYACPPQRSAEFIFPSATSALLSALSATLSATRLFLLAHHHPSNTLPSRPSSLPAPPRIPPLYWSHSNFQRTVNSHDQSISQLSLDVTRYLYCLQK